MRGDEVQQLLGMLRLGLNIADRFVIVTHMQQTGEGGHPVELFVAHDAQVVDIALHLAELGGEGIDFVAVAEGDHPALQRILQHNAHPAGEHGQLVEAAQLVMSVTLEHVAAGEKRLRRNDAVD